MKRKEERASTYQPKQNIKEHIYFIALMEFINTNTQSLQILLITIRTALWYHHQDKICLHKFSLSQVILADNYCSI